MVLGGPPAVLSDPRLSISPLTCAPTSVYDTDCKILSDPHQTTPLHMHGSFPITMATTSAPPRHDSLALQSQSDFSFAKFREFPQEAQQQQQLAVDPTPSPGAKLPPVQIPRNSVPGPASRKYDIPARPKPGRKPIETEQGSKRKLQNRMAQRNFRDRRAVKQHEMEVKMEQMTKEHDLAIQLKDAEIQHYREVINAKDAAIKARESEISMLQQQLSQFSNHRLNGLSPSTEQPSATSQSVSFFDPFPRL